ncbi:hypothetical protein HDU67_006388 [Dinochytrium kinnereticum]|nr:hypothetical protein HDU67_006388 [Dinochytrium kinnereticum]
MPRYLAGMVSTFRCTSSVPLLMGMAVASAFPTKDPLTVKRHESVVEGHSLHRRDDDDDDNDDDNDDDDDDDDRPARPAPPSPVPVEARPVPAKLEVSLPPLQLEVLPLPAKVDTPPSSPPPPPPPPSSPSPPSPSSIPPPPPPPPQRPPSSPNSTLQSSGPTSTRGPSAAPATSTLSSASIGVIFAPKTATSSLSSNWLSTGTNMASSTFSPVATTPGNDAGSSPSFSPSGEGSGGAHDPPSSSSNSQTGGSSSSTALAGGLIAAAILVLLVVGFFIRRRLLQDQGNSDARKRAFAAAYLMRSASTASSITLPSGSSQTPTQTFRPNLRMYEGHEVVTASTEAQSKPSAVTHFPLFSRFKRPSRFARIPSWSGPSVSLPRAAESPINVNRDDALMQGHATALPNPSPLGDVLTPTSARSCTSETGLLVNMMYSPPPTSTMSIDKLKFYSPSSTFDDILTKENP